MRRYLRRMSCLVDQDQFNTSQACSACHNKLVLVYRTGNSPPSVPSELLGPPVGPPPCARRVRMAAGSRRGRPRRPLPAATHVTRRGSEIDLPWAAARATAYVTAVTRRAAELAACAGEDRGVYVDPSRRGA